MRSDDGPKRAVLIQRPMSTAFRRGAAVWVVLVALAVVACSGSDSDSGTEQAPWPDGLTAFGSREPFDYQSRHAFVRFLIEPEREVTVTRVEVSSPRFEDVIWTGTETFDRVWDLEFDLPLGECGGNVDAEVTLTYAIGDGSPQISRTTVEDRYESIRSTLDRDCAATTLREAAEMRLGEGRVEGRGRHSVYVLPVTFTPTGKRDDVTFRGVGSTVLFRHIAGSASSDSGTRIPLTGDPVTVPVRLEPARCDQHALMEGKRGTYIPVHVQAPELRGASFYLPLDNQGRGALMEFFASHCGL
jgi:hypothetical protein